MKMINIGGDGKEVPRNDHITFDEEKSITLLDGQQMDTKWKYVSNGMWFDKDATVVLETDCCWMGGLFRGIRTSQMECEVNCGKPLGSKYEDGELCMWEEFDIYDENGILLAKAANYVAD